MHVSGPLHVYVFVGQLSPVALRFAILLLAAANAFAGEYAILASGATMRADRHEDRGASVRLYMNGGYVDVPADAIVRFEPEYVPQPKPTPQQQATQASLEDLITEAAERWHLPRAFLDAVVRAESGYRTDAVSPKGALGLMQLMPGTARMLGADPKDPKQNVEAGARYLSDLLRKYLRDPYQVRKAVAAYNAGSAAVDRYHGVPPYDETVRYVDRVVKQWRRN
jgi:soluble lytic murein transglycosylase-like protein